jgi:hypothetical protein
MHDSLRTLRGSHALPAYHSTHRHLRTSTRARTHEHESANPRAREREPTSTRARALEHESTSARAREHERTSARAHPRSHEGTHTTRPESTCSRAALTDDRTNVCTRERTIGDTPHAPHVHTSRRAHTGASTRRTRPLDPDMQIQNRRRASTYRSRHVRTPSIPLSTAKKSDGTAGKSMSFDSRVR